MISLALSALPCGDARWTTGHFRSGLMGVPRDEVADDLRGAAHAAAFGWRAGSDERLPLVFREVHGQLRAAVCWHPESLLGGYPVSLDERLRVGTHPDNMNSMNAAVNGEDDGWVSTAEHAKFDDWGDDDAASIERDLRRSGTATWT